MSGDGIGVEEFSMVGFDGSIDDSVGATKGLFDVVPKEGIFLGLDISKNSTGVTLIENGDIVTGNISLDEVKGVHKEVLLRRELKNDLMELVEGKNFDLIIVEDAYIGENADTVRTLFALNTAIDEMILDGVCECKEFIRVHNGKWKSWLSKLDEFHVTKGLNDKEKVRICLGMIGVNYSGDGYQDRLDSTGMIVGYFLKGKDGVAKEMLISNRKKVKITDVIGSYEIDQGYLFYGRYDIDYSKVIELDYKTISKKKVLELLTEEPTAVFMTKNLIKLGNLGIDLGLDVIEDGGYFAFCINPKKKKKYFIEV